MISQTLRPACWVIVNDGSVDNTGAIIDELADRHPFVRALHRQPTMRSERGAPVGEAFLAGLEHAEDVQWDFVVKLDGDVTFEPHYFEALLRKFEDDPALGLASGICQEYRNGVWEFTPVPADHVTAASKVYRRACYEDIGGIEAVGGWNTLDELRAMRAGWRTRNFTTLPYKHHRVQGGADEQLKTRWASGVGAHSMGTDPLFFLFRALEHTLATPAILSPLAMLAGFWWQTLRSSPRVVSDEEMVFYREFQRRRMEGWLGRKRDPHPIRTRGAAPSPVADAGPFEDIERTA
jgi:glycosyltransferase involved in cell wall biosynthesis